MKTFLILAGALALAACAGAAGFQNGSFEVGTDPGGSYLTVAAGDSSTITGWTVGGTGSDAIDYIGGYWQASDGVRSLDLGGLQEGSISQTFDTVANQTYLLTFDLSGNPDFNGGNPTGTYIAHVTAGSLSQDFTYHNTDPNRSKWPGGGYNGMEWQGQTAYFTAGAGTSTTLTFLDVAPPGAFGPALDNVAIQAVPEPFTMGLGLAAVGLFARRHMKAKSA